MALAYTYYPGCSVGATCIWYDRSLRAVAETLGIELVELEDWNCCGATLYMSVRDLKSFCIAARNLAIAEPLERDLVTPCNACFTVLHKANSTWHEHEDMRDKANQALAAADLTYKGTVKVRHIIDPLINDFGLDAIREHVKQSLGGIKIAAYYGCQIVRPETGLDSPDYPVIFDQLLASIGAEPVDWTMKTRCCGASLVVSREETALDMIADILQCAADAGAEAIATLCPMCHINLETQMAKVNAIRGTNFQMPVLFFSQLMGYALGLPESQLGIEKGFIDARPLLNRYAAKVTA